jgi:hypothetical protein
MRIVLRDRQWFTKMGKGAYGRTIFHSFILFFQKPPTPKSAYNRNDGSGTESNI